MTTYVVTTSNWNSPAFWSGISEGGAGHTLDFSALPANFSIDWDPALNEFSISDGTQVFVVKDDGATGPAADASFGGTTLMSFFSQIVGTQGDDYIYGTGADDTLIGGAGNDSLFGEFGNDSIVAGDGDDLIQGQWGDDTIDGGAGSDTVQMSDSAGVDSVVGGEGGTDRDVLDFLGPSGIIVTFSGDEAGSYSTTGGSGMSGTFSQFEIINATQAADTVDASAATTGTTILGNGGNDSLVGGSGDDTLAGGTGVDTLDGGGGRDTFLIEDGFGNDTIIGGEAGDDRDTIDLSGLSTAVTVTYTGDEAGTITNGTHTISFSQIEHLILTDQADLVDATLDTAGIDVQAGAGNDTITGGAGNDTIDGQLGNDSIRAGEGNDFVEANPSNEGSDTVFGEGGNDTIQHSWSTASVDGGAGDDYIVNVDNTGPDFVTTITGGLGDDTYALDSSEGGAFSSLHVVNLQTGQVTYDGGARDQLSEIENVDIVGNAAGVVGDANANQITASGNFANNLQGGGGDDTISAGAGNDTITGGTGNDLLSGEGGADTFVFIPGDGHDTITDFNFGNIGTLDDGNSSNNDFVDLSGYYDHISELYADHADDGILNQSNTTDTRGQSTDYSNNSSFGSGSMTFSGASADESSFTQENTGVVCFTAGTRILTERGEVLIEQLCPDDRVITRDNGAQSLRWIARRALSHTALAGNPRLLPIRVLPGLTGGNEALIVSPQHGVLVRQPGGEEVLVRARHLAALRGGMARIMWGCRQVTYLHLMFDTHQIIFANGAAAESFYPGPQALAALTHDARAMLQRHLPDLACQSTHSVYGTAARQFVARSSLPDHLGAFCPA